MECDFCSRTYTFSPNRFNLIRLNRNAHTFVLYPNETQFTLAAWDFYANSLVHSQGYLWRFFSEWHWTNSLNSFIFNSVIRSIKFRPSFHPIFIHIFPAINMIHSVSLSQCNCRRHNFDGYLCEHFSQCIQSCSSIP